MKHLILFFTIILLLSPTSFAAIGKQGLIINGGKESITIHKGQKIRLRVRDRTTNLPVAKDITFASENSLIATIDEDSGILRGNSIGTTNITVMRSNGNGSVLKVQVVSKEKAHPILIIFPIVGLIALFIIYRKRCE